MTLGQSSPSSELSVLAGTVKACRELGTQPWEGGDSLVGAAWQQGL